MAVQMVEWMAGSKVVRWVDCWVEPRAELTADHLVVKRVDQKVALLVHKMADRLVD